MPVTEVEQQRIENPRDGLTIRYVPDEQRVLDTFRYILSLPDRKEMKTEKKAIS